MKRLLSFILGLALLVAVLPCGIAEAIPADEEFARALELGFISDELLIDPGKTICMNENPNSSLPGSPPANQKRWRNGALLQIIPLENPGRWKSLTVCWPLGVGQKERLNWLSMDRAYQAYGERDYSPDRSAFPTSLWNIAPLEDILGRNSDWNYITSSWFYNLG